jgi:hypothetical protein
MLRDSLLDEDAGIHFTAMEQLEGLTVKECFALAGC